MNSEYQQWQEIKANYLKQIEKNLAQVDHPQRSEILANVCEHLDSRYAELSSEQKNWESFQQIITEMGPPEEYAELLAENQNGHTKKPFGINEFLAIAFVIVLAAVGSYLVYTAKKVSLSSPSVKQFEFELDEQVLGKWIAVDFVKTIDDFDPKKKNCSGDLFLLYLDFKDNGKVAWKVNAEKERLLQWTKGKVEPHNKRPSFYYLRNIDAQTYLFYEWVSGDVTRRGREPAYYVLKQFKDNESVAPAWFENDPQAIGDWISVDFVKTIEDFDPERQQTSDLFLKTLHFEDNGRFRWTVGESKPIGLEWTRGKIRPFDKLPSAYFIRPINKTDYLFYEYRTNDRNPEGYYVFKRTSPANTVEEVKNKPFENDPQVLGQWVAVDFVKTSDEFKPDQPSWRGKLWVKALNFQEQGIVEWSLGEDQMKINHHWTKGKLLDDQLSANYFIETYEGSNYLFMEWNSGDVTVRGQKPAYYVLKKQ
jgi:hypothetical protein